mmetsp:Transcript_109727/g.315917  ORF Transcript_109727/g.315917 Transcript_109727/m.315917 type:complete len:724 (-) Transcript_109727:44-2215(-)
MYQAELQAAGQIDILAGPSCRLMLDFARRGRRLVGRHSVAHGEYDARQCGTPAKHDAAAVEIESLDPSATDGVHAQPLPAPAFPNVDDHHPQGPEELARALAHRVGQDSESVAVRSERRKQPLAGVGGMQACAHGGAGPNIPDRHVAAADAAACADETGLLQLPRNRGAPHPASSVDKTLALEGGGWLALVAQASVFVGLTAATNPQGTVPDLFRDFSAVSSSSGGSWLGASLIFSPSFIAWLDEMVAAAEDPDALVRLANEWFARMAHRLPLCDKARSVRYVESLIVKMEEFGYNVTQDLIDLRSGLQQQLAAMEHSGADLEQGRKAELSGVSSPDPWAEACQVFFMDWTTMVPDMLKATATISPRATIGGGGHLPWANGKTWIVTLTLPARTEANTTYDPRSSNNFVHYRPMENRSTRYVPRGDDDVPQYIPAKVSWTFGAKFQPPGRSFCGDPACFGLKFVYEPLPTGGVVDMAPIFQEAFVDSAGDLPISMVASASSAFDGRPAVSHSPLFRPLVVTGEGAVWAARRLLGRTFLAAKVARALSAKAPWEIAALFAKLLAPFPLVDGGDTDLTGIANAVAVGAKRVVSVQCAHYDGQPDSFDMFLPEGRFGTGAIFDVTVDEMATEFRETQHWTPGPSGSYLLDLRWFTKELKTVDNPAFGIKKGRKITVTFLFVGSQTVDIGPPMSTWEMYGSFTRDIVSTLVGNETFSKDLLKEFLGK